MNQYQKQLARCTERGGKRYETGMMSSIVHKVQWNSEQQIFLAWLSLPRDTREPRTQGELATVLGVSPNTLVNWKKIPGFVEEANDIAIRRLKQFVPDVLATLVARAVEGKDIVWTDRVLEMAGLRGRGQLSINQTNITMTEEEAYAIYERAGLLTARIVGGEDSNE